ncbi:MAG: SHOCT domain-containing protein [Chloroflexi bacterium]|nr:SHOCT domain-containing protein [Chloroflexota bacterium]
MRGILAFGIFLIVVAAAILIFGLVPPTNEPIGEFLAGFVCEANEDPQLISDSTTNQDLIYYCVDAAGNRRDISGWVIGALTVLYLVPFTAGLAMTIYAGTMLRRRQFEATLQHMIDTGQISPQSVDIMKGMMQRRFDPYAFAETITAASHGDLSSRLKQLDEALDKGLVSKDEYDRAREGLLRNFTQG